MNFEGMGILCVPEVGEETIRRHGLRIEVGLKAGMTRSDLEAKQSTLAPLQDLLESVHLPFALTGRRVNVAALDEEWRRESLATLETALEQAAILGAPKVVTHAAPRFWDGQVVGEYERLVEGMRTLGNWAQRHGILVCIENNRTYWDGCDPNTPPEKIDRSGINEYFAELPEAWRQLAVDVQHENVRLCLDTSHATTTAHRTSTIEERLAMMAAFLDAGDWIAHVHWSDSTLADPAGRNDRHLPLGAGDLPREIHQRVLALPATRHLERPLTPEGLMAELTFIQALLEGGSKQAKGLSSYR